VEDAPRPAGVFGRRPPAPPKPIDNAFQLWQGRVTVHDRQVFTRRPADLVRIFAVAETYGAPVYSYARDLLVQELQRLGPSLAADRDAHLEFWQYPGAGGQRGPGARAAPRAGRPRRALSEVGRLRARAQHSLYHVYTVDTHTVFALQRLMRLRAGALSDAEPELTRIARAQQRPLVLMLGLSSTTWAKGSVPTTARAAPSSSARTRNASPWTRAMPPTSSGWCSRTSR